MQKIDYPKLFAHFAGREADLRQVTRYHIYRPMYYRSHLLTHSKRVLWILQSFLPLAEQVFEASFDSTKAQLLAVVHDDPEIVMGDIQAGHKMKMSPEELVEVARLERDAITQMARRFPYTVLGYNYGDLMSEGQEVETLEAQLVKYADRFDAFGEALHEVHAGNRAFTAHTIHDTLGVIEIPIPYYMKYFPRVPTIFPRLDNLIKEPHVLFQISQPFDMSEVAERSRPHTDDSITRPSGFTPYDFWKGLILENGDKEEIENLYQQKEF